MISLGNFHLIADKTFESLLILAKRYVWPQCNCKLRLSLFTLDLLRLLDAGIATPPLSPSLLLVRHLVPLLLVPQLPLRSHLQSKDTSYTLFPLCMPLSLGRNSAYLEIPTDWKSA